MKTHLRTPVLLALILAAPGRAAGQIDQSAWYHIVAKHSGKCLDVQGAATTNGAPVAQWDCHAGDNQLWQIVPAGEGYYKIVAKHSGKALDVFGGAGATADGVAVGQWDYNGGANQMWKLARDGEGYYTIIARHSGKSLDINGGPGATANGAIAQQWTDAGGANQRWRLTPVGAAPVTRRAAVMSKFDPAANGFQFANTFTNDIGAGAKSDGLCGGMMYAAIDYFLGGGRVPTIDYRPAIGTPLQTYLFNRQTTQIASNLDRFEDMILASGPRGDKRAYFERGLREETLREIRGQIDSGVPVVLALQNANDSLGHSVLAIGYDMGRYRGDLGAYKEDVTLYVYDPNHPRETRILTPDVTAQRYVYREQAGQAPDEHAHWLTYFVDTRYRRTPAPAIHEPDLGGADGLVRELRLTIKTGGDELAGGNDEVRFTLYVDGRPPQVFESLNHRMRWISNYEQTLSLPLASPARAADIRRFDLAKTARPTPGGIDLWDLDSVDIRAYGGGVPPFGLFHADGHPLTRFTEHFTTYSAEIPRVKP